ncbi:hypothetical protein BGZ90_004481 [Linnemannia elongata]|nr:hypothetical protein BGZ90_004481 [Linnemannia elongata]
MPMIAMYLMIPLKNPTNLFGINALGNIADIAVRLIVTIQNILQIQIILRVVFAGGSHRTLTV